ncbi:MAG: purine-nucleoside phosphorylase [Planctomycetales bacterium]|nr:purine-nucleoside phosphorylase [Planctomycetales bacterium]
MSLPNQIADCVAVVRQRWTKRPRVGIVLGTGLGGFVDEITAEASFTRDELPHFPRATALSHRGRLVCGVTRQHSVPVVVMEGRFHVYEGHAPEVITLPVRVMHALGIELLILTNACGGLNPDFAPGDIALIEDHINLMGTNPLIGPHDDSLGPRFPDLGHVYDPEWIDRAVAIAQREEIALRRGVYIAVSGPNYETRAEIKFLRLIGGDLVGMSTVPEAIVAAQCGLRTLAFSIVTNSCDTTEPILAEDVVANAATAETNLRRILLGLLEQFKA